MTTIFTKQEVMELNRQLANEFPHDGTWPNRSEPDGPSRNIAHESSELGRVFRRLQDEVRSLQFMGTNIEPSSTLDIQIRMSGLLLDTESRPTSMPIATSLEEHTERLDERAQSRDPLRETSQKLRPPFVISRDNTTEEQKQWVHSKQAIPSANVSSASYRHSPRVGNVRRGVRADRRSKPNMPLSNTDQRSVRGPRTSTRSHKQPSVDQTPSTAQSPTALKTESLSKQSHSSEQLQPAASSTCLSPPETNHLATNGESHSCVETATTHDIPSSSPVPSSAGAQPQSPRKELSPHTTSAKPKEVLVVEDNKISQIIATKLIEKGLGFSVTAVDNGLEGVQMYTTDPSRWQAIFIGLSEIPAVNGYTAVSLIRAFEQDQRIQDAEFCGVMIVGMTAWSAISELRKIPEAKIDHAWVRPQRVQDLGTMFKGHCRCFFCHEKSKSVDQGV